MNRTTSSQNLNAGAYQLPSIDHIKSRSVGAPRAAALPVKAGPGKAVRRAMHQAFKGVGGAFKSIGERLTKAHQDRVDARAARQASRQRDKLLAKREQGKTAITAAVANLRATRARNATPVTRDEVDRHFQSHLATNNAQTVLRANDEAAKSIQNHLAPHIPTRLDEALLDVTELQGPWPLIGQANKLDFAQLDERQFNTLLKAAGELVGEIENLVASLPEEVKSLLRAVHEQTRAARGDEAAKNAVTGVLFLKFIVPAMFDVTTAMSGLPDASEDVRQHKAVAAFCIELIQAVANGATETTLRDKRVPTASEVLKKQYVDEAAALAPRIDAIALHALH